MSVNTTTLSTGILEEPKKGPALISNAVFGMCIFVFTEIMFFMALISAFLVIQKDRGATWDLPDSIPLPYLVTSLNTAILFVSGAFLLYAGKKTIVLDSKKLSNWLLKSAILGGLFVFIQGSEWIQLIDHGMTLKSTIFGACFFLLVGTHALHAVAGVFALVYCWLMARQNRLTIDGLRALQIFWLLIVCIWPVLYGVVYF